MDELITQSATAEIWTEGLPSFAIDNPPPRVAELAREPRSYARAIEQAVATQIVPRLVLAGRAALAPQTAGQLVLPADVHGLADAAISPEEGAAMAIVAGLRGRGLPLEAVYLDLLAPAARRLGEMWDEDETDFTTVSLGLWRLHGVLRAVGPAFWQSPIRKPPTSRVLLAPVPGAQHNFGVLMVADFFRRAGWSVWCEPASTQKSLVNLVRTEWFAVVGLSMGTELHIAELAACIRAIRRASRNRRVGILVGGPIINERPELVQLVGADTTGRDGWQAVLQAQGMLSLMTETI